MGCTNSTEKRPKDRKRSKSNAPQDYPDHLSPPEIKITETDSDRRPKSSSSSSSSNSKKGKYRKHSKDDKDDSNEAHHSEGLQTACVKEPEPELIACEIIPPVEEVKVADDQNDVTANETDTKSLDDKPAETENPSPEKAPEESNKPESDHEDNQSTEAPE
jgi:hypothetical protein